MSKTTDIEANATSLDGLVCDNGLIPTLRNGPKPSYQYLVDGWNNGVSALIQNTEDQIEQITVDATAAADASEASAQRAEVAADKLFKGTTQYLITEGVLDFEVGDTVTTNGFYTDGDGGGAQWVLTGGTNSPSKTPSELGTASFTDSSGRVFTLTEKSTLKLRSVGWTGDGTVASDDVLKAALNFASENGGMSVCAGESGIIRLEDGEIVIPKGVSLVGSKKKVTRSNAQHAMPQINIIMEENKASPAIILTDSSSISGFSFLYPRQVNANMESDNVVINNPVPYGWTITTYGDYIGDSSIASDLIDISNVMLYNSYNGINIYRSGQSRISNVFGQPINVGFKCDQMLDVCYINTMHFWTFFAAQTSPLGQWIQSNGKACHLGNVDSLQINDLFAYGYNIGLHLDDFGTGGPWLKLQGGGFDRTENCVVVDAIQGVGYIDDFFMIGENPMTSVGVVTSKGSLSSLTGDKPTLFFNNVKFWNMASGAIISSTDSNFIFNNPVLKRGYGKLSEGNDVSQWLVVNEGNGSRVKVNGGMDQNSLPYSSISGTTLTWVNNAPIPSPSYSDNITNIFDGIENPITGLNWSYLDGADECITETAEGFSIDLSKTAGTSVARYNIPQQIKDEVGIFVLECNIETIRNGARDGTFAVRIMNNNGDIRKMLFTPSSQRPFFNGEKISIPFTVDPVSTIVYFDLVMGTGDSAINIENLNIYRVENSDKYNSYLESIQGNRWSDGEVLPITFSGFNKIVYATDPPLSGLHSVGDVRINTDPTESNDLSWVYTSSGNWRPWSAANSGDVITKDVVTSQIDTTADRVLVTGAGGVLGQSPTITNANSAPLGVFGASGQLTNTAAAAAGFPDLGVGSNLVWWNIQTMGISTRQTQVATQVFASGIVGDMYTRTKQDAAWSDWMRVHTDGNTVFNTMSNAGGTNNQLLGRVTKRAGSSLFRVFKDLSGRNSERPVGISVTGTFSLRRADTGGILSEVILSTEITNAASSSSRLCLQINNQSVSDVINADSFEYELCPLDANSKIEINY